LSDRDFLSDKEIERLEGKFPNYKILRFYDFENYLYHPDNIAELNPVGFNREGYIAELLKQKNSKGTPHILAVLDSSRRNYEKFKTDGTMRDKHLDSIINDPTSEDFACFYKFYDMKEQFNKSILASYNLRKEDLVRTAWFRSQISAVLG
jgi:hypothetical protein